MYVLVLLLACVQAPSSPEPAPVEPAPRSTAELVADLDDPGLAPQALEVLVDRGAVDALREVARSSPDLAARGHAIQGLVALGTGEEVFVQLQAGADTPELVRVWAIAGRIRLADPQTLDRLRPLARQWPELKRPISLRDAALKEN